MFLLIMHFKGSGMPIKFHFGKNDLLVELSCLSGFGKHSGNES